MGIPDDGMGIQGGTMTTPDKSLSAAKALQNQFDIGSYCPKRDDFLFEEASEEEIASVLRPFMEGEEMEIRLGIANSSICDLLEQSKRKDEEMDQLKKVLRHCRLFIVNGIGYCQSKEQEVELIKTEVDKLLDPPDDGNNTEGKG